MPIGKSCIRSECIRDLPLSGWGFPARAWHAGQRSRIPRVRPQTSSGAQTVLPAPARGTWIGSLVRGACWTSGPLGAS
jgi:hypothetical protein